MARIRPKRNPSDADELLLAHMMPNYKGNTRLQTSLNLIRGRNFLTFAQSAATAINPSD